MNDLRSIPGIFIRSMGRAAPGGLCRRRRPDAVDLMDAAGRNLVLVETVGVGQDEVDVMRLGALGPRRLRSGSRRRRTGAQGGVLEIADVHVVNKADRDGADRPSGNCAAMASPDPLVEETWVPRCWPPSAPVDERHRADRRLRSTATWLYLRPAANSSGDAGDRHRAGAEDRRRISSPRHARQRRPSGAEGAALLGARGAARKWRRTCARLFWTDSP